MGNAVKRQQSVVVKTIHSHPESSLDQALTPPFSTAKDGKELESPLFGAEKASEPVDSSQSHFAAVCLSSDGVEVRTESGVTGVRANDTTSSGIGSLNPDAMSTNDSNEPVKKPEVTEAAASFAAVRLRLLLNQLGKGDSLDPDELKASLGYAVGVLESVAKPNQERDARSSEEPEELPEVTRETVPDQVRLWLASTFTSQAQPMVRRRSGEAIKHLRGIVHAVRWNIKMDKVYKQVVGISYPIGVKEHFQNLDKWTFDVFELDKLTGGQPMRFTALELFKRYDLATKHKISLNVFDAFLLEIESGYKKHSNFYHNAIHAADVLQAMHSLLWKTGIKQNLSDLEVFASLLAAIIHDFEHTGTTNSYHVQCRSQMALLYNDKAVLENHHLSAAFQLMQMSEFNILSGLSAEDYKEFRALVIEMVLATDMSAHFQQVNAMKSLLASPDIGPDSIDKPKALSLMLHSCDISHPLKEWNLHETWTNMLIEEFFRQGDKEKELNLPFSPLCDRTSTLVPESQVGFINFIVMPSLEVLRDLLDVLLPSGLPQPEESDQKTVPSLLQDHQIWIENLAKNCQANLELWKSRCGEKKCASPVMSHAKDQLSLGSKKPESGKRLGGMNVIDVRPRPTGHQRLPGKPSVIKQSSNKSMKVQKPREEDQLE